MELDDVILRPKFGKWDSKWSSFIASVDLDGFKDPELDAASDREAKKLKLAISLIGDLKKQGWKSSAASDNLILQRPDQEEYESKESIRQKHLVGRDLQLLEPTIREFISKMECRRLTKHGWKSILHLS